MRKQTLEQRKADLESLLRTEEGFANVHRQALAIVGERGIAPMTDIATLYEECVRIILEHEFPSSAPS